MEKNTGMVYFDKKNRTFCQLRKYSLKGAMCSYANYYADALTTICEAPYSDEYMEKNFKLVEDIGLDKIAKFDGVGWVVIK